MTQPDLKKLKELAEKATPGPSAVMYAGEAVG